MSYTKHNFQSGDKLYASELNEMDEQIYKNESDIGNKVNKKFSDKVVNKQVIKNSQLEDLLLITPEYLLPYLDFIKENKAIYKIAYSQPNVLHEQNVVSHLYKNIFEPILDRFLVPKNEQKYMINFYL